MSYSKLLPHELAFEDLEDALDPEYRVLASRDRARRGRSARSDPDRDRVEVERQADGCFGQAHLPVLRCQTSDVGCQTSAVRM